MRFTEDHDQFRASVRQFVDREVNPFVDEWEAAGIFPAHDLLAKLRAAGLLGLAYDSADGAPGAHASYTIVLVVEWGRTDCGATFRDRSSGDAAPKC